MGDQAGLSHPNLVLVVVLCACADPEDISVDVVPRSLYHSGVPFNDDQTRLGGVHRVTSIGDTPQGYHCPVVLGKKIT